MNKEELKARGKAVEGKANEEAKRLEAKTGVPKEIWIGLAIVVVIIVLAKVFG